MRISDSELTTRVSQAYTSPPGGLLGNPDTYYIHDGGLTWTANVSLRSTVDYVRVSYSLFAGGMGGPAAFGMAPSVVGATLINTGSYLSGNNTVFYSDLQLTSGASQISAEFGDLVFPNFPGSFRSLDAVQVEVFDAPPISLIPEPSSLVLLAGGMLALAGRRKRLR